MIKLSKLCNKYSGNTYALVEIQLNICRNTMDFTCDLEPFSEIRSHINSSALAQLDSEGSPHDATNDSYMAANPCSQMGM